MKIHSEYDDEPNFEQMHFETVGRIPAFARSMIIAAVKK